MKNRYEVRPLRRGEESLWVSLGIEESLKESQSAALAKSMSENDFLPAENRILAMSSNEVVGKLSGIREAGGYIATKIVLADRPDGEDVAKALFDFVRPFGVLRALSWADRESDLGWRKILFQSGFSVRQEKAYFRKKIEGYVSPHSSGLTYRSIAYLGTEKTLELFGRVYEGSASRDFTCPRADFESHHESAGHLFDPDGWFIA